ncbi:MAG: M50 family metallopeptidase [Proteobacteria bacterium]|jgi:regulator of sigma E protease|nr:M50 family metallopeptidase [Pseudomonadota bacterium]
MSIAISIIALGLLIAFHELGHYAAARLVGMRVLRYSIGFFKPILSWTSKKTGIVYQVGILPLGGFVQIKGMNPFEEGAFEDPDSYQTKSAWRRAAVIAAGPAANFALSFVVLWALFAIGGPMEVDEARVGAVSRGGPAERAGLEPGDRVIELDGRPISTWEELSSNLHESPGKRVELLVERGEARRTIAVTPEDKGGMGLIGIGQPSVLVRYPVHGAAGAALGQCTSWISMTFAGLKSWMTEEDSAMSPVGPVGIVKMAASSLDVGPAHFIVFVAYLSVMLFLFNLFPLPALDGGRCLVLLGETITRRRLNRTIDAYVNTAGFFLVLGLIAVITVKEVFFG